MAGPSSDAERGALNCPASERCADAEADPACGSRDSWAAVPVPTYSLASYFYTRFRTILGLRYVDVWEALTLVAVFLVLSWLAIHISAELWQMGGARRGALSRGPKSVSPP